MDSNCSNFAESAPQTLFTFCPATRGWSRWMLCADPAAFELDCLAQVAALCQISGETRCHVEKQHLNNKLKTITAYFGDTFSADLA